MHTPYVIRGNGPPDGTAPSGLIAAMDREFYASFVSISRFCVLRGLVPPFSGFFLYGPSIWNQPFAWAALFTALRHQFLPVPFGYIH